MKTPKRLLKYLLQSKQSLISAYELDGISKHYSPEEMVGKQVTKLVNLAPIRIMGVESQGMTLMAEDHDGKLRLIQPNEAVQNGSGIS